VANYGPTDSNVTLYKSGDTGTKIYIRAERFEKSKVRKPLAIPIPLMNPPLTLIQDFGIEIGTIVLTGFLVDEGGVTYGGSAGTKMQMDKLIDEKISNWWSDSFTLVWGDSTENDSNKKYRKWKGAVAKFTMTSVSPHEDYEIMLEFKISQETTGWDA
tara:strand:- start:3316 stop:3789 length:474 start_codon:yes stop_codon:yes gene_type:complete